LVFAGTKFLGAVGAATMAGWDMDGS